MIKNRIKTKFVKTKATIAEKVQMFAVMPLLMPLWSLDPLNQLPSILTGFIPIILSLGFIGMFIGVLFVLFTRVPFVNDIVKKIISK